jgi:hypothetical protein
MPTSAREEILRPFFRYRLDSQPDWLAQCAEITARRNLDSLAASGFGHMLAWEGRGQVPPVLFVVSERHAILSAVQQYKPDHPLGPELGQAERQIKKADDAPYLIIEVRADPVPLTGPFWVLAEAIRKRRRCWITYVGHSRNETRQFAFEPSELELDEAIRVSGHVVGNLEPKCLTVGRIAQAHLMEQRATSHPKGAAQPSISTMPKTGRIAPAPRRVP